MLLVKSPKLIDSRGCAVSCFSSLVGLSRRLLLTAASQVLIRLLRGRRLLPPSEVRGLECSVRRLDLDLLEPALERVFLLWLASVISSLADSSNGLLRFLGRDSEVAVLRIGLRELFRVALVLIADSLRFIFVCVVSRGIFYFCENSKS